MKTFLQKLYDKHSTIYKGVLFILSLVVIVYMFPKGGQFKFEFQKGKPWQYDNLYAPFDFAIEKSNDQIQRETERITEEAPIFVERRTGVETEVEQQILREINLEQDSLGFRPADSLRLKAFEFRVLAIVKDIYDQGYLGKDVAERIKDTTKILNIRTGTQLRKARFFELMDDRKVLNHVFQSLKGEDFSDQALTQSLILSQIRPSISYDQNLSDQALQEELSTLSMTQGKVSKGELIILKGDIIEGRNLDVLNSLKKEYESQVWSASNYVFIVIGYVLLVSIVLLMLLLYLRTFRKDIFENNTKVTFIFFNLVSMILLTSVVVRYDVEYVYAVPLCILPIIFKVFFDARIALIMHSLTVLILGFIVPNSFEFIYLQIIAGVVTIVSVEDFYNRTNLFVSIGKIVLIYMLSYFAFAMIQEGNLDTFDTFYLGLFLLNGFGMIISMFLIYAYEKIFNLSSDVTLLELSNTNNPLLRELNEKAPGTFQHSMQVANLAEAAANEIGANAMLVRTGALYHDIGKMKNPFYFIENQTTGVNPHDEISPKESGKIIIGHVLEGIRLARKNKLPDRVIDFIRTHHGDSVVYYFYRKAQEEQEAKVDVRFFTYPGPRPFSKETAILMMADSVEAASKSLEKPNAQMIDDLVEKIITKQLVDGQFQNASITLKEITQIKRVLKKKLMNIYHLRIEYPD